MLASPPLISTPVQEVKSAISSCGGVRALPFGDLNDRRKKTWDLYRPNPRRRDTFALSLLIHIGPGIGTNQIRVILDRRILYARCDAPRIGEARDETKGRCAHSEEDKKNGSESHRREQKQEYDYKNEELREVIRTRAEHRVFEQTVAVAVVVQGDALTLRYTYNVHRVEACLPCVQLCTCKVLIRRFAKHSHPDLVACFPHVSSLHGLLCPPLRSPRN